MAVDLGAIVAVGDDPTNTSRYPSRLRG